MPDDLGNAVECDKVAEKQKKLEELQVLHKSPTKSKRALHYLQKSPRLPVKETNSQFLLEELQVSLKSPTKSKRALLKSPTKSKRALLKSPTDTLVLQREQVLHTLHTLHT